MSNMQQEEHVNRERWLVSYADFITLLFAFFVVMYAISSLNEGKYRVISDSLKDTFKNPLSSMEPIQLGTISKYFSNFKEGETPPINQTINNPLANAEYSLEIPFNLMSEQTSEKFKGLIDRDLIEIKETSDWIEIEIKSSLLFGTASSELSLSGQKIISDITEILKKFQAPITVEGFTDNVPIKNDIFPSNWELSVGRAASVVRLMQENGVDSNRLNVVGYGENFPKQDNRTAEGQFANRRVVLLIERANKRKQFLKQGAFVPLETLQKMPSELEENNIDQVEIPLEEIFQPSMSDQKGKTQ